MSHLAQAWLSFPFAVLSACSPAAWNRVAGDSYELDDVSRQAPAADQPAPCRPELLRFHRGEGPRWEPPLTLAAPFQERVARFEALAAEVGKRVYGRAPTRVLNAGAYACRAVEHRQQRLSEHALGNAVDVTGFRFPALAPTSKSSPGTAPVPLALPRPLERAFTITVARDYPESTATEDAVALKHRDFFEQLAAALRQAAIFRGMLGPADPRHRTHLHLDMGPWSYEAL